MTRNELLLNCIKLRRALAEHHAGNSDTFAPILEIERSLDGAHVWTVVLLNGNCLDYASRKEAQEAFEETPAAIGLYRCDNYGSMKALKSK